MNEKIDLGIRNLNAEELMDFVDFYQPLSIESQREVQTTIHHQVTVEEALKIIKWMTENEVCLVYKDSHKNTDNHLFESIQKVAIQEVPFKFNGPKGAYLLANYSDHIESLKKTSQIESIYVFEPSRTLTLMFDGVLDETIPPEKFDVFFLSRAFDIAFEDWFLALILMQLDIQSQNWMLKNLDSRFVSSIHLDLRLSMMAGAYGMFMPVEVFAHAIKHLIESQDIETIKQYSFLFNYQFFYND